MSHEAVELHLSEEVKEVLESRHILDEEIKMVIYNAETKGDKLYQPGENRYLAKMKSSNVTFYVEYSIAEDKTYVIHTAYCHKAELKE